MCTAESDAVWLFSKGPLSAIRPYDFLDYGAAMNIGVTSL